MPKKSVFAGHSMFGKGAVMAREYANMKTIGYLSYKAKKPNRWKIERVDTNTMCLQTDPCQHSCVLHLTNGIMMRAPFYFGSDVWMCCKLIGVTQFSNKGHEHFKEYEKRVTPERMAMLEKKLDEALLKKKKEGEEKTDKKRTVAQEEGGSKKKRKV